MRSHPLRQHRLRLLLAQRKQNYSTIISNSLEVATISA
jgi:hypothetical protein